MVAERSRGNVKVGDLLICPLAEELGQKRLRQHGNVILAFPKCRKFDMDHGQPEIEIFAEIPRVDFVLQFLVSG